MECCSRSSGGWCSPSLFALCSGTSTSYFEGARSLADGPPPPNPSGVPQVPPPNLLNVPLGLHPSQPSAPSSLVVPQQVEEGRPETHPPDGGGRADSGPVEGVGSLVQHPIEEQGQPTQGDLQRGPGQGMNTQEAMQPCAACQCDCVLLGLWSINFQLEDHAWFKVFLFVSPC